MKLETSDIMILIIGTMLLFNAFIIPQINLFQAYMNIKIHEITKFITLLVISLNNWRLYLVLGIIALPFLSLFNYRLINKIKYLIEKRKNKKIIIENQISEIKTILNKNLTILNSKKLRHFIFLLNDKLPLTRKLNHLKEFRPRLKVKLKKAYQVLSETRHKEKLEQLITERENLKEANEELEEQIRNKEYQLGVEKSRILSGLVISRNNVYKKEDLNDKEVEVLLENKFTQINEYCVYEKKFITVLVKKVSNHSPTHVFLVWSILKLLHNIKGLKDIKEHLSIDADITFKYYNNLYAIEVETGNLLWKKQQLEEKVKYLNRKYQNRWFFVASNRNLARKFRKFGPTSERKNVINMLKKMLKLHTRQMRV